MNELNGLKRILLCLIAAVLLASGCTITHRFGPYKGKVVDKEIGEPISGAVVFMQFFTEGIGPYTKYIDAIEVSTDENGEFEVSGHRITKFRMFHAWQRYPLVIIFKPGYGAYPMHKDVIPKFIPGGSLPEEEYVTIKLPRLETREERKKNLSHLYASSEVPLEKQILLRKARNVERVEIGLPSLSE